MSLCGHVGDLIEGAADEVHELKFGDGTHAGERRAKSGSYDRRFCDGRIDDALGAKAIDEPIRHFKGATVDANVLTDAEHSGIAFHFFPDPLADRFEISEGGHVRGC